MGEIAKTKHMTHNKHMKYTKNTREKAGNDMTVRETTLLELAAMVIKENILDEIKQPDTLDIVDELVECRAEELVKSNKSIKYSLGTEAFTCEICCDRLYIIKHRNINEALMYATIHIGEISIVFNNNVVVIGGYQKDTLLWGFKNCDLMYKINLGGKINREEMQDNNLEVYDTVEVK